MIVSTANKGKSMKSIKRIEIRFARVADNCPMGTKIFCGKDADVLAANYQSAHPELKDISFKVIR